MPSEVTQSLVVLLLKTTVALELELVLVNRPHLINSYEVGITAGPLACMLLGYSALLGKQASEALGTVKWGSQQNLHRLEALKMS